MKFVYVVVSNKNDYYIEYCAVSIYSLKKYNKEAEVLVICDSTTYDYIRAERKILVDITDEFISVPINKDYTSLQKSRFLKTSVRNLINDDFIFIDTDTIITGDLKDLMSFDKDIGAVKTQDSNSWNKKNQHFHFKRYNIQRDLPEDFNYGIDHYFNSGVIVCRNTEKARKFYETWHKFWIESTEKYSFHKDQCDFNRTNAIYNNLVTVINGAYNFGAIYPGNSMMYFNDCKIFHYFSSSIRLKKIKIKDLKLLDRLNRNGFTPEIDSMIENIKLEYLQNIYNEGNIFFSLESLFLEKKIKKIGLYLKNKILYLYISIKLRYYQRSMKIQK